MDVESYRADRLRTNHPNKQARVHVSARLAKALDGWTNGRTHPSIVVSQD